MNRRDLLRTLLNTSIITATTSLRQMEGSTSPNFTYYVDPNGSDSNDGRTPATALKSVAKVNSLRIRAGQSVGFKAGGVWRETLVVNQSGAGPAKPITYGAYGSGAQPIITGANPTEWSLSSFLASGVVGSIWISAQIADPFFPSFIGLPGNRVTSVANLKAFGDWFWDGSGTMFVFSSSDPTSAIEVPCRPYAVTMSGGSYITFKGLTLRGGQLNGFFGETNQSCDYVTFDSCTVELNYSNGIYFQSSANVYHSNGVARNCVLRNNGSSGLNLNGYHKNWYIGYNSAYQNCLAYNGNAIENTFGAGITMYSATGLDGTGNIIEYNTVYNNGVPSSPKSFGAGLWSDTCTGVTFRYNVCFDNWTWGIYLEKNHGSVCHHNVCYDNAGSMYTANIGASVSEGQSAANCQIFNNTCSGGWWGMYSGGGNAATPDTLSTHSWINNISVLSKNQNFYIDSGANNDGADGWGNVYSNNCFGPEKQSFLLWMSNGPGRFISQYSEFDAAYGSSTQSINGDPLFVGASSGNFKLQANSPCRGAGMQVQGFSGKTPNVGAF